MGYGAELFSLDLFFNINKSTVFLLINFYNDQFYEIDSKTETPRFDKSCTST